MVPLRLAKPGCREYIKRVGGKAEVRKHLENLGFVPGALITVISETKGDVIVRIREARVAISHEMANKILV